MNLQELKENAEFFSQKSKDQYIDSDIEVSHDMLQILRHHEANAIHAWSQVVYHKDANLKEINDAQWNHDYHIQMHSYLGT